MQNNTALRASRIPNRLASLCPSNNEQLFRNHIEALFDGDKCGNLSTFFYSSPNTPGDMVNGYGLFRDLCGHPDYYLRREEVSLIAAASSEIAAAIGSGATVIELGPGAKETVRSKTLPILRKLSKPQNYIAIDYNPKSAQEAAELIFESLPFMKTESISADFTTIENFGGGYQNPVFMIFGNTLGNIEGSPNIFNPNIISYLRKLRRAIGRNGKLLIAYDCNEDKSMIDRAYNNPIAQEWIHNIVYRMRRDGGIDINPGSFDAYAEFSPSSYCMEIGLRAIRDDLVHMGTKSWLVPHGKKFHAYNSYKFTPAVLKPLLDKAGFQSQRIFVNKNHKAAIELLTPQDEPYFPGMR